MKNTGRKMSLLIVALSSLGLFLYTYLAHGYLDRMYVFATAFYFFFGWRLGKYYDKVKYHSEKDILTGSYNRRFVMEVFPSLKRMTDRRKQKLIIFLIDVDDFKSINDHYDHAAGDRVLQRIASTLKQTFRESNCIARWGGDEFICIFPSTDKSRLNALQARLHKELNKLSNQIAMKVSVSAGYVTYPDEGVELNELIKIADRKMFIDKLNKKDQAAIGSLDNLGVIGG